MNKKLKYWLIVSALGLFGGVVGYLAADLTLRHGENGITNNLDWQLYVFFPYDILFFLMALVCVVLLILVFIGLFRLRSQAKQVNEEELYSPAELAVSRLMMQVGILQSVSMVWLFSNVIYSFEGAQSGTESVEQILSVLVVSAVITVFVSWFLLRRVMHKMNELMPRLAIDLYDTKGKHHQMLEQRMDESERLQMYKAGFMTMRSTMAFLMIVSFAVFLFSLFFEPQLNLLLILGAVYVFMQARYFQVSKQFTRQLRSQANAQPANERE